MRVKRELERQESNQVNPDCERMYNRVLNIMEDKIARYQIGWNIKNRIKVKMSVSLLCFEELNKVIRILSFQGCT